LFLVILQSNNWLWQEIFNLLGSGMHKCIFEIGIFLDPIFYDSKHGVKTDFTGINQALGICISIVWFIFLWTTLRKRNKNRDNNRNL
jgi:hypothetical protein